MSPAQRPPQRGKKVLWARVLGDGQTPLRGAGEEGAREPMSPVMETVKRGRQGSTARGTSVGSDMSLWGQASDVRPHSSWSWTPSSPTRPVGSAETSMVSLCSTSSSPMVSPSAQLPMVAGLLSQCSLEGCTSRTLGQVSPVCTRTPTRGAARTPTRAQTCPQHACARASLHPRHRLQADLLPVSWASCCQEGRFHVTQLESPTPRTPSPGS